MKSEYKITFRLSEAYSQRLETLFQAGYGGSRHTLARQLVMVALDAPERDVLMTSLQSLQQGVVVLTQRCDEVEAHQLKLAASFASAFELLFLTLTKHEPHVLDPDRLHDVMLALFLDS